MRVALIFLCTLYFACAPSRADESGIIMCIYNMGMDWKKVLSYMNNENTEGKELYGCFLACILEKKHAMVDNEFQISLIDYYIAKIFDDNEDIKENMFLHVHHCIHHAQNKDKCVAARLFMDCTKKHLDRMDLRKIIGKILSIP